MRFLQMSLLICVSGLAGAAPADTTPQLHGYGGRSCVEYLDAWRRWEAGQDTGIRDYFGYQQWLAGLVSGLSLATDTDVLRGAEVEGMMRRINMGCENDRGQDVFSAAMTYLQELSALP